MSKTLETAFAKIAVAFVAIAMMFSVVAPASAQNVEDMSLEDLIALVTQLQSQLGGDDAMTSDAAVCPYTWTRNLNMGATGADVMALQQFLNSMPETQVAPAGSAGSAGMETQYYGPATGAAVANFQMKYRSEILSPLGLVNPTTFFGNSTRAQANDLCVAGMSNGGDEDEDEDEDEDDSDFELGGEASLDSFEIDDASDSDIEEGEEDAEIGSLLVEFSNGDAEISRIDIALLADGHNNTSTVEPWEAFESVSLWVDGDKVAEMNADDEDDYLDEDDGTLRFSGLDIVGMEDEEIEIVVAVTVMNNLDTAEITDWNLFATAMRFFDADGVATTETETGDLEGIDNDMSDNPVADFTVDEAGSDDEIKVSSSNDDPEATTLILQDDDEESYVVFAFDLDTDDSTNDVEINQLVVDAVVSTGTAEYFINNDDVTLLVDGDELDIDDVTVSGNTITFDFDGGDFVIDAGEEVTVEMEVTFDALASADQGATIAFTLTGNDTKIDAEGADDITGGQITGAANGETHTLITEGIVVLAEDVVTETDTSGDNDTLGEFTIEFDVTAYEDTFYITDNAATDSATDGAMFIVEGPATSTATITSIMTSTGDEDTEGVFTIDEGATETFTLEVTVDVATAGLYRVRLAEVWYSAATNGTGGTARVLAPASDYRTDYETIQAN